MSDHLHKRALLLSYITVGYNILEGIISIAAGVGAGSIALIGFGLDSFIESFSGGVMIWRFRHLDTLSREEEERVEKKAIKLVGYSFFILAAYIFFESAKKLIVHEIPDPSLLGIIIALVSIIIMPLLFYLKFRTGKEVKSKSLVADSKQTLACTFMSLALLLGLGLNYLIGFWQADPIVGFIIVAFLVREGYGALKTQKLCCC